MLSIKIIQRIIIWNSFLNINIYYNNMACKDPTKFTVNLINEKGQVTGTYTNIAKADTTIKKLGWPTQTQIKTKLKNFFTGPVKETSNISTFTYGNFDCYISKRCENKIGSIDYTCISNKPYPQTRDDIPSDKSKGKGKAKGNECPHINIHNSKNEWDVIQGSKDEAKTIHCNDGYSFNHDLLHQGGKIKCASVPKPNANDYKYNWYIKDDYLEGKCNKYSKLGKKECEGDPGMPAPSYNPYVELHNLPTEKRKALEDFELNVLGNKTVPIGCVWDETAKKCIFRRPVNVNNNAEPLCTALHCPKKEVPFSNKTIESPLPGPTYGKHTGNCVKPDGTIYEHIDSPQDCICHRHKACNTCTYDNNCQWCDKGPKKGCYYTHSNAKACPSPIKQKGGGTCRDDSTNNIIAEFAAKPLKEQTIDNCEKDAKCVSNLRPKGEIPNWKSVYTQNYEARNQIKLTLNDRDLCNAYNNNWDYSGKSRHVNSLESCYLTNNRSNISGNQPQPIVFTKGEGVDPNYYISLKPGYCANIGNGNINCSEVKEKNNCRVPCEWKNNGLSDSELRWTSNNDGYKDKVIIYGNGNCNLCEKADGTEKAGVSCLVATKEKPNDIWLIDKKKNTKRKLPGPGERKVKCEPGFMEQYQLNKFKDVGQFAVGEKVYGLFQTNKWYPAEVADISADGNKLTLNWKDKTKTDREKPLSKVRKQLADGEVVEALYSDGNWYPAKVVGTSKKEVKVTITWLKPTGNRKNPASPFILSKVRTLDPQEACKMPKCTTADLNRKTLTLSSSTSTSCKNPIKLMKGMASEKPFTVHKLEQNKYIKELKYDGKIVTIDQDNTPTCKLLYNSEFSEQNRNNIDMRLCSNLHYTKQLNTDDELWCLDGIKYCKPKKDVNYCGKDKSEPVSTYKGIKKACKPDSYICNAVGAEKKGVITCSDEKNNIRSNCVRDKINNGVNIRDQCNLTYNKLIAPPTIYPKPYDSKKYAECKVSNSPPYKKEVCEMLNKYKSKENPMVHWGKVCNKGNKTISHKAICTQIQITVGGKAGDKAGGNPTSGKWVRKNDNTWGCYVDNKELTDDQICGKIKGKWKSSKERCIIETDKDIPDKTIEDVCGKWSIPNFTSDIEFKYHQSKKTATQKGFCIPGRARPTNYNTDNIISEDECKKTNNTYKRKNSYSNVNVCPPKSQTNIPDENLNWTGGEIKSDYKNNWKSDCSSTILSTCQVACDTGFGGGGDYVCHYNNHSDEVCKKVEKNHKGKKGEDLETMCNRYVNCVYDNTNQTCSSINKENIEKGTGDDIIGGQMEWLGSECYKINNSAFAHGIYNYPSLDAVLPPFVRLILFALIIIIILIILYLTGIIGKIADDLIYDSLIQEGSTIILQGLLKIGKDFIKGIQSLYYKTSISLFGYDINVTLPGAPVVFEIFKFAVLVLVVIGISGILTDGDNFFYIFNEITEVADEEDEKIIDGVSN